MLFADPAETGAGIIIEDDVLIGSGVHIYVGNHAYSDPLISIIDQGYAKSEQVIIKKGSWVGANVIVLPGVTIGENTVIGAGSIVTNSVPAKVVAVGNPCRIIRHLS